MIHFTILSVFDELEPEGVDSGYILDTLAKWDPLQYYSFHSQCPLDPSRDSYEVILILNGCFN